MNIRQYSKIHTKCGFCISNFHCPDLATYSKRKDYNLFNSVLSSGPWRNVNMTLHPPKTKDFLLQPISVGKDGSRHSCTRVVLETLVSKWQRH